MQQSSSAENNQTVTSEVSKAAQVEYILEADDFSVGKGLIGIMHMILQSMYVSKKLLTDENLRSTVINTLNNLTKICEPDGLLPFQGNK